MGLLRWQSFGTNRKKGYHNLMKNREEHAARKSVKNLCQRRANRLRAKRNWRYRHLAKRFTLLAFAP